MCVVFFSKPEKLSYEILNGHRLYSEQLAPPPPPPPPPQTTTTTQQQLFILAPDKRQPHPVFVSFEWSIACICRVITNLPFMPERFNYCVLTHLSLDCVNFSLCLPVSRTSISHVSATANTHGVYYYTSFLAGRFILFNYTCTPYIVTESMQREPYTCLFCCYVTHKTQFGSDFHLIWAMQLTGRSEPVGYLLRLTNRSNLSPSVDYSDRVHAVWAFSSLCREKGMIT